jgi:hypothetical protein
MGGLPEPLLEPRDEQSHQLEVTSAPNPALPCPLNQPRPPPGSATARGGGAPLGGLGSAGGLSPLTFSWVAPLLHRGSTQGQLHHQDLFELPPSLLPAACGRRLWRHWLQVGRNDAAICRLCPA